MSLPDGPSVVDEIVQLRDALESMCFQYLAAGNDCTVLEHSFMSAGEQATAALARLFPREWEDTGCGARWIGPVDKFGHPSTHSWATSE